MLAHHQIYSIDSHINKLREVISLMKEELVRKNGSCGGQLRFGLYTAPVKSFDNEYGWEINSQMAQKFKTIPCLLKEGINAHEERIAILLRIQNGEGIKADEYSLLMQVEGLAKDPKIAQYSNIGDLSETFKWHRNRTL